MQFFISRSGCDDAASEYLTLNIYLIDLSYFGKCLFFSIPGLYFEEGDANVHEEYHGIGIRIEDDILITHTDPIVLTVACLKDPDDIEKIMAES